MLERAFIVAPASTSWGGSALVNDRGELVGIGSLRPVLPAWLLAESGATWRSMPLTIMSSEHSTWAYVAPSGLARPGGAFSPNPRCVRVSL